MLEVINFIKLLLMIMGTLDSLIVVVKPNGRHLSTFDGSGSDGLPCICAQLVGFQRVAKEHPVVWLDHLKRGGVTI